MVAGGMGIGLHPLGLASGMVIAARAQAMAAPAPLVGAAPVTADCVSSWKVSGVVTGVVVVGVGRLCCHLILQ